MVKIVYQIFFLSLSVLLIIYYFDIKPAKKRIKILQTEALRLQQEIKAMPERVQLQVRHHVKHLPSRQLAIFSDFFSALHVAGIDVQVLDALSIQHIPHYRLRLLGSAYQLTAFIQHMQAARDALLLKNFSCQQQLKQHLSCTFLIAQLPYRLSSLSGIKKISEPVGNQAGLLCSTKHLRPAQTIEQFLQHLPLSALSMVGYWQQGGHKQALLSLPNHEVFAIEEGVCLGPRRACVKNISADALLLILPDKQQKIMHLLRY